MPLTWLKQVLPMPKTWRFSIFARMQSLTCVTLDLFERKA